VCVLTIQWLICYTCKLKITECCILTHTQPFYCSSGICPGPPGWAGTRKVKPRRLKPIWIYWSKRQWVAVAPAGLYCKSAPHPRQPRQHPTTQFFTGRMPFLPPNQQCQSTEVLHSYWLLNFNCGLGYGADMVPHSQNVFLVHDNFDSNCQKNPTHHPLASRDWMLEDSVLKIKRKQQRRSNCKNTTKITNDIH